MKPIMLIFAALALTGCGTLRRAVLGDSPAAAAAMPRTDEYDILRLKIMERMAR